MIRNFGGFRLSVGARPLDLPPDFPAELFSYLCHHIGLPQRRSEIAAEFWPNAEEAKAKRALSTALWRIRTVEALRRYIDATPVTLCLGKTRRVWIDTLAFPYRFARLQRLAKTDPTKTLNRVKRLLLLYEGPAYVRAKTDWGVYARFDLENTLCDLLYFGAQLADHQGDSVALNTFARRLRAIEPYRDDIRQLQVKHALEQGHLATAQREYRDYRRVLRKECDTADAVPRSVQDWSKSMKAENVAPTGRAGVLRNIRLLKESLSTLEQDLKGPAK